MKSFRHYLLFVCSVLLAGTANAQFTFEKIIGGAGSQNSTMLIHTSDNGFAMLGNTNSSGAGDYDICLIKLNPYGDTLWTRTYGGSGEEYAVGVAQTADDGYAISGYTKSFGASAKDVFLLRTDQSGMVMWTKRFAAPGEDYGNNVQQTTDGGFILTASSTVAGGTNYSAYLIKTDANGDTLWTRWYGGALEDDGNYVQKTQDGGYIITGTTLSFGAGGVDIYVVKTNATGDTLWTRTYGGPQGDYGFSVRQLDNGEYIITGVTSSFGAGSYDSYLMKLDVNGNVLWTKVYGGTDWDSGFSIEQTSDNGFIILGQSFSFGTNSDIYLIKTDANGDTLWTRSFGGSEYEYQSCIVQTSDQGYLISANEESFGSGRNIYFIKTDSLGYSGCNDAGTGTIVTTVVMPSSATATVVGSGGSYSSAASLTGSGIPVTTLCTTVDINESSGKNNLVVYPNPFENTFNLRGTTNNGVAAICDLSGKVILQLQTTDVETTVDTKQLNPGFYLINYRDGKKFITTTLVKL